MNNFKHIFFVLILGFALFSQSLAQENRIYLDDDLLVSGIDLHIHNDNWIIYDRFQQKIYLINPENGELIREIHSDYIHPGFSWLPIIIRPLDEAIFVVNSAPFGFYIGYKNEFLNELDMDFEATGTLLFTQDYMLGFYVNLDFTPEIRVMDMEGKVTRSFEVDLKFPLLDYRMEELVMHLFRDKIIIGSPNQNEIHIYGLDGTKQRTILLESDYFIEPSRDLSRTSNAREIGELMEEFFQVKRNTSDIMNSFMVTDNELLVYMRHNKTNLFEYLFINLDTNEQRSQTIPYPDDGYLTLAQDGKLYFTWYHGEKTFIEIKTLSDIFSSYR